MALSDYVSLGRSGLRVSPFCLGAMTFGEDWGWGSNVEDSQRILDRFIELGGNFIDTANGYTKGHSEKIIGDRIGRYPARRDRLVIATKFFTNMYRGDPNGGGASRKSLVAACDESLRRLQTDYIDLYWMHCWDRFTPIEETVRALDDLVCAGKVRYIGCSNVPAWGVAVGLPSSLSNSNIRSLKEPLKANSSPPLSNSDSVSRPGRLCAPACSPANILASLPLRPLRAEELS